MKGFIGMTVPSDNNPEQQVPTGNDADNNGNPDPNQNPGHPAWKEILDVLPDSLHGIITPKLQDWDRGVQQRFQEIHQQYNPYKKLVENQVPAEYVEQALYLANQLETNPAELVQKAIEHFNLEQFKAQANNSDDDYDEDYDMQDLDDLRNDPRLKPFFDKQDELAQYIEQQQQAQQEQQSNQEMQNYLAYLHENYGNFDDIYVTALVANGVDGEVAVKQFQNTVNQAAQALAGNQQTQQNPPPVVMGAGGSTGSGVPDQPVNFGGMERKGVNDLVEQYLQRASENNS